MDALNPAHSSVDGILFNRSKTTLIQFPGGKAGTYTIPDSATSIGTYALYDCNSLTSAIRGSVTSIGDEAFAYCTSLTNVPIGKNVKSIGTYVFSNCTCLTNVGVETDNGFFEELIRQLSVAPSLFRVYVVALQMLQSDRQ